MHKRGQAFGKGIAMTGNLKFANDKRPLAPNLG
jgi:hypothetical protein